MSRLDLSTATVGLAVVDRAGRKGTLREIVPHAPGIGPVFKCAMADDPDPQNLTSYALGEVQIDDGRP